jgi:predicted amidohydrolase YtcJ
MVTLGISILVMTTVAAAAPPRPPADLVLFNGKIVTVDKAFSIRQALAVRDGKFLAVGSDGEIRGFVGPATKVIDLKGRTVLPGLIDSHIHAIRAGRTWDLELNWVSVKSLAEGMQMIVERARTTPPGTWIRVVGGWHETQFTGEKRMPSVAEIDQIVPNHPVWFQRLYERAILNTAGLKALGITNDVQDPPLGRVLRDNNGRPIGVLGFFGILNWYLKLPQPALEQEIESSRNFFRELNRVGLTTVGDVAGGGLMWPQDYRAVNELHRRGELAVRIRWYMQPNRPGQEIERIKDFVEQAKPFGRDDWMRPVGVGEQVTVGVFDGDAFAPPPPTFKPEALEQWKTIVRLLAERGWRFQVHATRDNSARQLLPAIEEVAKEFPHLKRQRIAFAHLEDASTDTIERIKALGGGITVQDRLIYYGEEVLTLGPEWARRAPPLKTMLARGVPVGGGTDAHRTAPYPPFWSIWWMITGKTLGGVQVRAAEENLNRQEALRVYTLGSAWFTFDENKLGSIEPGKLADLIVLTQDYLTIPVDRIRDLHSVLTIVGGKPIYGEGGYVGLVRR